MTGQNKILKRLLEGNRRFVSGQSIYPNCGVDDRNRLFEGQNPGAVVLTCSDSRTPPELIFDQGFGNIFVVRTAGLCIDDITIGSIEYAVEHLYTSLILVVGHEKCGAVSAAIQNKPESSTHLNSIIEFIRPSIDRAKNQNIEDPASIIKINTSNVVETLKRSGPILSKYVDNGRLQVVGCHYLMKSGKVELLTGQ